MPGIQQVIWRDDVSAVCAWCVRGGLVSDEAVVGNSKFFNHQKDNYRNAPRFQNIRNYWYFEVSIVVYCFVPLFLEVTGRALLL